MCWRTSKRTVTVRSVRWVGGDEIEDRGTVLGRLHRADAAEQAELVDRGRAALRQLGRGRLRRLAERLVGQHHRPRDACPPRGAVPPVVERAEEFGVAV